MAYDYDPKRQQEIQEWFDKQYGDRKDRANQVLMQAIADNMAKAVRDPEYAREIGVTVKGE